MKKLYENVNPNILLWAFLLIVSAVVLVLAFKAHVVVGLICVFSAVLFLFIYVYPDWAEAYRRAHKKY